MRRVYYLLALPVVAGGLLLVFQVRGCDESRASAVAIPLDQVPAPLVKTAKEKLPEVTFDHARRLPNGNYEIRGKAKNGKVREVELTAASEVVEIE